MSCIASTFEAHYRMGDLARMWGLGRETVRKLVKDDPGVIKIRMGHQQAHTVYSVPESAARRIHTRLLNSAQARPPGIVTSVGRGLSSKPSLRILVNRACRSGTHAPWPWRVCGPEAIAEPMCIHAFRPWAFE